MSGCARHRAGSGLLCDYFFVQRQPHQKCSAVTLLALHGNVTAVLLNDVAHGIGQGEWFAAGGAGLGVCYQL